MKLGIISHTEHYTDRNGEIVGWGPTVREINNLAPHFEQVIHAACLHNSPAPSSSLPYLSETIKFIPLPPYGGPHLGDKLSVLTTMPVILRQINRVIREVDFFQLRLPTSMGNYLLPYLRIFKPGAKYWIKYANNWDQLRPPLGYNFQRWWLKNNLSNCKVTINGSWPNQPGHLLSFENPCLTDAERCDGALALNEKTYSGKLDFVFIGKLVNTKGVQTILEALQHLKDEPRLGAFHFIGDGFERAGYEEYAKETNLNCIFHGFMAKEDVNKILTKVHVLVLPSISEGFPKVVAEGANFGCIPVVTNISCIDQYIESQINGYLLEKPEPSFLVNIIRTILGTTGLKLKAVAENAYRIGSEFTFSYYISRMFNEIITQEDCEIKKR